MKSEFNITSLLKYAAYILAGVIAAFIFYRRRDLQEVACLDQQLIVAAENGLYDETQQLLCDGANVNAQMPKLFNIFALRQAAQNGYDEVAKLLLDRGARVDLLDSNGDSALPVAVLNGFDQVVTLLLEKGASADLADSQGYTPLFIAAQRGHYEIVKLLLEGGASVDLPNLEGVTPLIMAAQAGHHDIAELFLLHGANANAQAIGEGCITALHQAAQNGHYNVVKLLLGNGAIVDLPDEDGVTPLMLAQLKNHEHIVELFSAELGN